MKHVLTILTLVLITFSVRGQDIHFSQFTASPLTLNPAMTGLFQGDYRLIGNYRSQWGSVTVPYRTYSASADFALFREKLSGDVLGAGIVFFTDKAGDSEFSTSYYSLSIAYNKALGNNHYLAAGLQGGVAQRSIDYTNLRFGNQYDGERYNPNLLSGERFVADTYSYIDASVGLLWYYVSSARKNLYAGLALPHVTRPNQSFYRDMEKLYPKLVLHAGAQYAVSSKMDVLPGMVLYKKGPSIEYMLGSYIKFYLKKPEAVVEEGNKQSEKGEVAFYAGSWYRFADAIILATRIEYKNFGLAFSYDINTSELIPASHYQGGPELSLTYIGSIGGKKKNGLIFCPQF